MSEPYLMFAWQNGRFCLGDLPISDGVPVLLLQDNDGDDELIAGTVKLIDERLYYFWEEPGALLIPLSEGTLGALPESEDGELKTVDAEIDCHRSGDVLWLDMFMIPEQHRRKGLGTRLYGEWEKQLPPDIRLIRLFAADTGDGRSHEFWDSLGFEYRYGAEDHADVEAMGDETKWSMWKGVNGHPTPPTIIIPHEESNDPEE